MKGSPLAARTGDFLRAVRTAAGMTAADLRSKANDRTLSKSIVSRYEAGAVLPTLERLKSLAAACGAEVPADMADEYDRLAATVPHMAQVGNQWREFVRTWQTSPNAEAVAEALGITRRQAGCRAGYMRRHGVALKKMPIGHHGRAKVDWGGLAALAVQLETDNV